MVLIETLINVKSVTVDYVDFSRTIWNPLGNKFRYRALENVSFSINEGDVVALVGKNGGGKSTLLRVIAGLQRPSGGEIETQGSCNMQCSLRIKLPPGTPATLRVGIFRLSRSALKSIFESIL